MTPIQLEALTLRTVDQVRAGQLVEDAQVELKRVLPADPYKAARRVGGHANASRGQPVVWIIGLDEDEGVTGADKAELSDWWPQVQRYFDDLPPELLLQPMNVPVEGDDGERLTVVALAFDTSRLPFVVTAKGQAGPIQREVPYRDATGLRSAKRSDIIRLAVPASRPPEVSVLYSSVVGGSEPFEPGRYRNPLQYEWILKLVCYFIPSSPVAVVLPSHESELRLICESQGFDAQVPHRLNYFKGGVHVQESGKDLVFTGPGRFAVQCSPVPLTLQASEDLGPMHIAFRSVPIGSDQPITVRSTVHYDDRGEFDRAISSYGRHLAPDSGEIHWGHVPPGEG